MADQVVNQNPFGEAVLVPRLEGWEAVLRLFGYPEEDWRMLLELGIFLHEVRYRRISPNQICRTLTEHNALHPYGKNLADVTEDDCGTDA